MRAALIALALALCAAPALADELRSDRREAIASQAADLATTAAGLALGAVETNPLGVLLIVPKVIGYHRIKAAPVEEQPALWSAYQALSWAWDAGRRERDEFDEICQAARADAPGLVCTYTQQ